LFDIEYLSLITSIVTVSSDYEKNCINIEGVGKCPVTSAYLLLQVAIKGTEDDNGDLKSVIKPPANADFLANMKKLKNSPKQKQKQKQKMPLSRILEFELPEENSRKNVAKKSSKKDGSKKKESTKEASPKKKAVRTPHYDVCALSLTVLYCC